MAPPDPLLGFPAPGANHGHAEQRSAGVSAPRCNKRKTTAGVDDHHPEAETNPTAARRRISSTVEEGSPLLHLAGQFAEQTEGGSGFRLYDGERCNYQQQTAAAENGGTAARPIVIDDGDDEEVVVAPAAAELGERDGGGSPCPEPEPEQPAVMPLPACGEKEYPWFCFSTCDPTDGGRYELLSAYLPPPLPDADEEDALRWSAAVPRYFSPVDVFWGTENGVWMY